MHIFSNKILSSFNTDIKLKTTYFDKLGLLTNINNEGIYRIY